MFTIFVRGVRHHGASLRVKATDTVCSILSELHRHHLIPSTAKRAQPKLYYDSFQHQALDVTRTIQDVRIGALSVLSLRYSVPGGMVQVSLTVGQSFQSRKGFPQSILREGQWECIVCDNGKTFDSKIVTRHENQLDHGKKLKVWLKNLAAQASATSMGSSSNIHPVVQGKVRAMVASLLWDRSDSAPQSASTSHLDVTHDTQTHSAMDWDAPGMDFDSGIGTNYHQDAIEKLIGSLAKYMLDDGAINQDSNDELVEREEDTKNDGEGDTEESMGARFLMFLDAQPDHSQEGAKRGWSTTKVGENEPWFPWPDKECAFSDSQHEAIQWCLAALGISNIPSIQEMANPQVRKHMHFYPEDSGKKVSEARQTDKWLHKQDDDLLTPMVHIASQDSFVFEPALCHDGTAVIPHCFFRKNGNLQAKIWLMELSPERGGRNMLHPSNIVGVRYTWFNRHEF
ncbi:hypothetical protein M422DRAFT_44494 [Sphaerobolus stellatus SS14]|nr:hypothetical protein M422DRAFT_44494 [Sphaerobolus stellatus SS14]